MTRLCAWYGISRQAHYQMKERQANRQDEETIILEQVKQMRHKHPRLGTRKLHHELSAHWQAGGIRMGRDRLFDLLNRKNLLVPPLQRQQRTTWAGDWFGENLVKELDIVHPNQVWVSDITYLETEAGFVYLSLVTDAFSRRIMGYDLSTSLAAEGAERAL